MGYRHIAPHRVQSFFSAFSENIPVNVPSCLQSARLGARTAGLLGLRAIGAVTAFALLQLAIWAVYSAVPQSRSRVVVLLRRTPTAIWESSKEGAGSRMP